jgi:hypothetical protein
MGYAMLMTGIVLIVLFSPALLGAVLRLACRKTHIRSLSIAIGVLFAVLEAAFISEQSGALWRITSMQEHNFPTGAINAIVLLSTVLQIAIYAGIASLGIRLTDKLRGSHPAE